MADRKVLSVNGNVATFGISVKDRDKVVEAKFNFCKDPGSFKAYVNGLSPEDSEKVYNLAMYAADLKARASAREAVAVDSTIIKKDGKEIDLMALPVEKAVAAVNAAFGLAAITGGDPSNAFMATRRKMLEKGTATEQNGQLVKK